MTIGGGSRYLHHVCAMCAWLPPACRGVTAFLVRDGRLELKWSREKQRTRKTGRARRAMSESSGSYRTGHSGTPCTAARGTEKLCRQLYIYTGPLCASLGALPALAPALFVFVQTSGGGERGIRVEWQIMTSLCLAF